MNTAFCVRYSQKVGEKGECKCFGIVLITVGAGEIYVVYWLVAGVSEN